MFNSSFEEHNNFTLLKTFEICNLSEYDPEKSLVDKTTTGSEMEIEEENLNFKNERKIIPSNLTKNNIINLWRTNQKIFKGKFSSGATPQMSPSRQQQNLINFADEAKIMKTIQKENVTKRSHFSRILDKKQNETGFFRENINQRIESNPILRTPPKKNELFHSAVINDSKEEFRRSYEGDSSFMNNSCELGSSMINIEFKPEFSRFNNDFEILEVIGGGCFGTVYKCLNKVDGIIYAIKCSKNKIKGIRSRNLSLNEAKTLAFNTGEENLYVVRYFNAWIEDDRLYLVMEHCNYSIKYLIENQKYFDEYQIRSILHDILLGLKGLHSRNIVHLDIKPENILLSKTNKYKIADLGLSRISKRTLGEEINEGDSRYLAPELLNEANSNLPDLTKADIFSLGITIYELLTGEIIPCNGEEWHNLRNMILPKLDNLAISYTLINLVKSMVNPNPEIRPSASELLLSDFLQSEIEIALKIEKEKNQIMKKKINDYEKMLKISRKSSY